MTVPVVMVALLALAVSIPLLVDAAWARKWELFALFLVCALIASMLIGALLERVGS